VFQKIFYDQDQPHLQLDEYKGRSKDEIYQAVDQIVENAFVQSVHEARRLHEMQPSLKILIASNGLQEYDFYLDILDRANRLSKLTIPLIG
jgi:hypothetical protein